MVRLFLRRFLIALTFVLALEALALGAVPFVVPDITARAMRLLAPEPHTPPPDTHGAPAIRYARPLDLRDAFDTPSPLWDQSDIAVRDGHLAMQLLLPHAETYAIFLGLPAELADGTTVITASQPIDLSLTARMTQLSGADDASYGIRVRQSTPDTYVAVSISPRGYWRVQRSVSGTVTDLQPWTASHTIEHGLGYANELSVQAAGATITVRINGVVVGRIRDDAPSAGQVAFATSSTESGAIRVDFDDVRGTVGALSFAEDFSDESAHYFSTGGSLTRDGVYEISAGSGVSVWQNPLPRSETTAAAYTLSLDAHLVRGNPTATAYGVVLGDTGDFAHIVMLFRQDGTVQVIQTGGNQPAKRLVEPIQLPFFDTTLGATNHFDITVDPNGVTLAINGQTIGTLDSLRIPKGSVGMLLVSGDRPATVAFDNFALVEHAP